MPSAGRDLSARDGDRPFAGEVATRVRYAGTRVLCWRSDGGEVYAWWRADYWIVVHPRWEDGRLATLGGHGAREGGHGEYRPLFRGGFGAAGGDGEYREPGMSDGGLMVQTPQAFQDAIKNRRSREWTLMGRRGTLADIADVCAVLCSDEARFFTGHALSVDGGSSLMNSDFPLALQVPGIAA